ncbi:hypothetical protein RRG08_008207 [Elysia crispata]|uniref:Uncharacterized protein n=1 Tax=Elysia crispata TaxID=231223 RepID=A0AAE0YZ57_9GAST|nr:hypothetical protein RRG08_008207 [Elysia crispata]
MFCAFSNTLDPASQSPICCSVPEPSSLWPSCLIITGTCLELWRPCLVEHPRHEGTFALRSKRSDYRFLIGPVLFLLYLNVSFLTLVT